MNDTLPQNHKYSIGERVEINRISDKAKRRMYLDLERHIGKKGILVDYDCIEFNKLPYLKNLGSHPFVSIYTIKLRDGDIIQVPEEMLGPIRD